MCMNESTASNLPLQPTVWVVTPRAAARVAPTHPAAERRR
jgi:hypothetical protein